MNVEDEIAVIKIEMNQKIGLSFIHILLMLILFTGCGVKSNLTGEQLKSTEAQSTSVEVQSTSVEDQSVSQLPKGHIYLYGERHGESKILEKEFEIWKAYYTNQNMRQLYIELPYYSAEYMNLWMKSDSDEILDELYADWDGSAMHNIDVIKFYQKIKAECPETIFHGTDVGHQYNTTGKRFLKYLEDNQMTDSEAYEKTNEIIEQGRYYYAHSDDVYRENKMVENFMSTFDQMNGEDIMGIYGAAHTGLEAKDQTQSIPCMANQLHEKYADHISSEDLSEFAKITEPVKLESLSIEDIEYKGAYFGTQDLTGFKDYDSRGFWRLEEAYDHFKDSPKTGDFLPYDNYPMQLEKGQVFIIDYKKIEGTMIRKYYRSDGNDWNGLPITEEFTIDDQ